MKTKKKFFPTSEISTVHQNGNVLTTPHKGVTVELHYRDGEQTPCSAEIYGGEEYADISLEFKGNTLVGYDGCFDLPKEIENMVREEGFEVNL